MSQYFSFLLTVIIINGCHGQPQKTIAHNKEVINLPATSFTKLILDKGKLEGFILDQKIKDSSSGQLRDFYERRNYQFAWFTEDGISEYTRSFWNLHNNYILQFQDTALKYRALHDQMNLLLNQGSFITISPEKRLQTELLLTKHFFEYSKNAYLGKVDPSFLQWYIPRKKINVSILLDSFIARKGKNLQDWEPVNIFYARLKNELVHFYEMDKRGGWTVLILDSSKRFKLGDSALIIKQVKQRLQILGDEKKIDTSEIYTTTFTSILKRAQKGFGLNQNGVISAGLIRQLNVPVKERIRQLLINLERMRWVPQPPEGVFILVNIPEFRLHVFNDQKKYFSIDIVVGKEAHSTVIFTGRLKYLVFNPYWNVPPSIVRHEILPAMQRNSDYLTKMNMEQTGYVDGLPVIRQKPGGQNALGRVKFIFPNAYNVYFHDTPAKLLFKDEARAFSHGCIRLAEPSKLATYLLRNQPEWTKQKINFAMAGNTEKWVSLKETVPVFITYFTAWVDSEGLLNFREDIYGHDKKLAKHLFE